jgi:tRNA modification GTPase
MLALDDTIVAVATPPGAGAARAIVRISGRGALDCLRACFRPTIGWPVERSFAPRVLPGELAGPHRLPCELYVWPTRHSYTRQPSGELHTIGSPPLVEAAMRLLCEHGARLARPGEFTLRAFLAGRLDLTQAEAVLGVIDAHDRRTLEVAIEQLAGGLAGPLAKARSDLLDLLADLEAGLDFVEDDIEFVSSAEVARRVSAAKVALQSLAERMAARSLAAEHPRAVLIGWPNTGKSSLLNALAGAEAAMVSPVAGTTRDYVQATIRLDGVECLLVDTAGFDAGTTPETIASAAQQMTQAQHEVADLRLLCLDATRPLNAWERERIEQDPEALLVMTKCDQPAALALEPLHRSAIATSAHTGAGLVQLRRELARRLIARPAGQMIASTAARCRSSIEQALASLSAAGRLATQSAGDEVIAAELRMVLDELGKVTGAVYTDDVLDRIFSRFCIGK